jgi:hypothetical protein
MRTADDVNVNNHSDEQMITDIWITQLEGEGEKQKKNTPLLSTQTHFIQVTRYETELQADKSKIATSCNCFRPIQR